MPAKRTVAGLVLVLAGVAIVTAWHGGVASEAVEVLDRRTSATDGTDATPGPSSSEDGGLDRTAGSLPDPLAPDANVSYPTDRRYINEYRYERPPEWRPEHRMTAEDGGTAVYEVTRYPYADPTPEHLDAAWRLYRDTYEAARERGWFTFARAREDGYEPYDVVHYMNERYYFDDATLDPHRPESLIYYDVGDADENDSRKVLAGVMYLTDGLTDEGDQIGGPLTVWHYHPRFHPQCFASALDNSLRAAFDNTSCPPGAEKRYRGPEMLHVWFVRHPEGPFSSQMLGIADRYLERNGKMSEAAFEAYARESFDDHRTPD